MPSLSNEEATASQNGWISRSGLALFVWREHVRSARKKNLNVEAILSPSELRTLHEIVGMAETQCRNSNIIANVSNAEHRVVTMMLVMLRSHSNEQS